MLVYRRIGRYRVSEVSAEKAGETLPLAACQCGNEWKCKTTAKPGTLFSFCIDQQPANLRASNQLKLAAANHSPEASALILLFPL